jgi:hypothetical protein
MIAHPIIENFLEENQKIEKIILKQVNEVSFALFSEWSSIQQKIGEYLVDEAFCSIAKKHDAYILSNPVHPASYAHFIRSDVQSKSFEIRERTLRSGLLSGFLQSKAFEIRTKPMNFWIQGQQFYAVTREGKECLVKQFTVSDILLKASCYEDSLYIISDVDLVSIFLRNNSDEILFDSIYGTLSMQELMMIRDVNQYFQELISKYCPFAVPSSFRLIAHGPANRFSKSKASHLHYPLKVCTPFSSIEFLGQEMNTNSTREFLNFNRKMKLLGYHAYLNPKWEF